MVSIQGAVDDEVLKRISEVLDTAALTVYASDEIRLGFSYRRFERGRSIRALDYEDRQRPDDRGAWTRVDGERESWEILLFSERLKDLYLRYAPDEVADGCRGDTIHPRKRLPAGGADRDDSGQPRSLEAIPSERAEAVVEALVTQASARGSSFSGATQMPRAP